MDIRCIELYKQFRELDNIDLTEGHQWHVFGYYDSMNIKKIETSPLTAEGRGEKHPLECIYENSQQQSSFNSASMKKHVIYAIGVEKQEVYDKFWEAAEDYPLVLISLVHFKHPMMRGSQKDDKEQDIEIPSEKAAAAKTNPTIESLQRIKNYFKDKPTADLLVSVYIALDCNDAIIFILSKSIQQTIQKISIITQDHDAIQEIFTIHACQKAILNGDSDALANWREQEPTLETVNVFMRDENHGRLIAHTEKLIDAFRKAVAHVPETGESLTGRLSRYIIPGHEDILLVIENVSLDLFLKMYRRQEQGNRDWLNGFFVERLSRTVIPAPPPRPTKDWEEEEHNSVQNRVPELVERLKEAYKRIAGNNESPIWKGALMELLVELSNIEISLTAYDIYAQAINAQKTMIDAICELLESNDQDILWQVFNPGSDLTENIKVYLNGWSQLSFHAMHAEWQLTQSSDINRLYLFPAKLCRLYSSFMMQSSAILNVAREHDDCVFFLTPNICTKPQFLSIYRPIGQAYRLIHGEIPADFMFSPQVILPTLVHEAAHYSGSKLRNRKIRNHAFRKCVLAYLLVSLIDDDYLHSFVPETQKPFLDLLVDTLDHSLFMKRREMEEEAYGDSVIQWMGGIIDDLMAIQPSFLNAVLAEAIKKHPEYMHSSRLEQMLHVEEFFRFSLSQRNILSMGKMRQQIDAVASDIMSIFREGFSDICMIRLLDLSLEEYMAIICRGMRFNAKSERDMALKWAEHERYMCVLHTAFPDSAREDMKQRLSGQSVENALNQNEKNRSISVMDDDNILLLAKMLCSDEIDMGMSNPVYQYLRNHILYYLEIVSRDLQENVLAKEQQKVVELRNVYRTMADHLRSQDNDCILNYLPIIDQMIHLSTK